MHKVIKVYIHVGSAATDRQNWDRLVRYFRIHIGSFGYIYITLTYQSIKSVQNIDKKLLYTALYYHILGLSPHYGEM